MTIESSAPRSTITWMEIPAAHDIARQTFSQVLQICERSYNASSCIPSDSRLKYQPSFRGVVSGSIPFLDHGSDVDIPVSTPVSHFRKSYRKPNPRSDLV